MALDLWLMLCANWVNLLLLIFDPVAAILFCHVERAIHTGNQFLGGFAGLVSRHSEATGDGADIGEAELLNRSAQFVG
jgi:hypothetical protein